MPLIAALYVRTDGHYFNRPGIDPWDEKRDARLYRGPWRVIAHPPCQRWGKMYFGQPLAVSKGTKKQDLGADDGCFEAAHSALRAWGGVLEHPRGSKAWNVFGINVPPDEGGWIEDGLGGYTCCFEQGKYGHYARKATYLIVHGKKYSDLPDLKWGLSKWTPDPAIVARMGGKKALRLKQLKYGAWGQAADFGGGRK